ncbi:hypothetical protein [Parahaliea aestuarii]|uniref:Uncharacterized protein n=1 Tax=Parahaliea aestuarii TaxID=1852021 RepID=A0A5C8ZY63_9GAMM|nr:hypothetical protein [Parahaliea aestuarii]TXS93543.1 hypothetical protein FVW59_06890 [Parahaliea aestuarii]
MKLSFLCVRHRRWLCNDPAAALYTWLQCYEQGLRLERQGQQGAAIRQAGCAMETAEILLCGRLSPERDDITRFTHSTLLLGRLLQHKGAFTQAADCAHGAIDTLQRCLAAGLHEVGAVEACEQLAPLTSPPPGVIDMQARRAARQLH